MSFSPAGGVEIEENWDKLKSVTLPTGAAATSESAAPLFSCFRAPRFAAGARSCVLLPLYLSLHPILTPALTNTNQRTIHLPPKNKGEALAPLVATLPLELRPRLEAFIRDAFAVFEDLDCTMLEMNPFTLDPATGG